LAAQGLQGLQGLCLYPGPQGLAAQGLHGFIMWPLCFAAHGFAPQGFAAQGLHGLAAICMESTLVMLLAAASGRTFKAPTPVSAAILTAVIVFLIMSVPSLWFERFLLS
jgi:hypothetical protein